jgi:HAE1 family hydrophobic/amphiphilic exporter-1
MTMLIVVGFRVGIYFVNTALPSGFIPLEDEGII